MKNNQQTVGFLRLIGSIFYDSLLLTAVLFFATFALLLIPQQLQHAGPYLELAKLAWYVFVSYCYFAGFWYKGRQTPGMRTWQIELVDMQGGKVTMKQVTLRFFSAILSWLLAGLGFLWRLIDRNNYSLHDHLSGSKLQRIRKS